MKFTFTTKWLKLRRISIDDILSIKETYIVNEEIIYSPQINELLQSVCSIVAPPKEVDEYNIFSMLEISDKEVIVTADYSSAKF